MVKIAIYPGSFDPVTNGHIDLIQRATQIFDKIIVGVANNTRKKQLFTIEERMAMLEQSIKSIKGGAGHIEVESFEGLVIEYAKKKKVNVLIRGLRMLSDFEYSFTSSTLLKETASLGANLSSFVPGFVEQRLKERLKK
jgi:pantetheine-phosphate adenylyltransferase